MQVPVITNPMSTRHPFTVALTTASTIITTDPAITWGHPAITGHARVLITPLDPVTVLDPPPTSGGATIAATSVVRAAIPPLHGIMATVAAAEVTVMVLVAVVVRVAAMVVKAETGEGSLQWRFTCFKVLVVRKVRQRMPSFPGFIEVGVDHGVRDVGDVLPVPMGFLILIDQSRPDAFAELGMTTAVEA